MSQVEGDWKGALVFEETEESVRRRSREMNPWRIATILVVVALDIMNLYFIATTPDTVDWFSVAMAATVTGFVIFMMAAMRSAKPYRFYENAFEYSNGPRGGYALAYSMFDRLDPPAWYSYGYYRLRTKNSFMGINGTIPLPASALASPEQLDFLRSKLANPGANVPLLPSPTDETRARLRRLELAAYPLLYLASILINISIIGTDLMPGELSLAVWFAVWMAPMFYPLFVYTAALILSQMARSSPRYRSESLGTTAFTAVIVLALAFSMIGLAQFTALYPPTFDPDPGQAPASSALAMGSYSDASLYPAGDVLVDGALALDNVTLTMADGAQIWVAEGGSLHASGCAFASNGTYRLRSFGTLDIADSTIGGLWGVPEMPDQRGGLEAYGGTVRLAGCAIGPSSARTVMASGADSVEISDCDIAASDLEGIILLDTAANITGTRITGGDTGLLAFNSAVTVANCTLAGCQDGMVFIGSEARVTGTAFSDIPWNAISWDPDAVVQQSGNSFSAVGSETGDSDYDWPVFLCTIPMGVEAAVALALLFRMNKGLRQWSESGARMEYEWTRGKQN